MNINFHNCHRFCYLFHSTLKMETSAHDSQKRCLFESKIPRNLELLTNLNMDLLSELKQRPPNGLHFSF